MAERTFIIAATELVDVFLAKWGPDSFPVIVFLAHFKPGFENLLRAEFPLSHRRWGFHSSVPHFDIELR